MMTPLIVDLAVKGVLEEKTLILWMPSGHSPTSYIDRSWNNVVGTVQVKSMVWHRERYGTPQAL
jgi:hypothetical protein